MGDDVPYVSQITRENIERSNMPLIPGHLNYAVTRLVDGYLRRNGLSYESINQAIGALECAKLELYRRVAAPYENRKIVENGDVFHEDNLTK